MNDIRMIRENPEEFKQRIEARQIEVDVDQILALDTQRRALITQVEEIKAERNAGSKLVGKTKDPAERQQLIDQMAGLGDKITALDTQATEVDRELNDILLGIPNLPDADVPIGKDETENVPGPERGAPLREFGFEPKPHWDLAEELELIDFERAAKIAGSRTYILRGDLARLQRALIDWMLDVHTSRHGYLEVQPPYQVFAETLVGTSQLPKFADTLFHDIEEDKWLIPTAEVPVTNFYREEILDGDTLPVYHVAATPCFRREKVSAGRDVRGIKRVFQFMKVELVKFVKPEESADELMRLVDEACYIAEELGLHYRLLDLCTGDLGFGAAHTYDIEVWAPGCQEWLEVSSCSNMRDFQARRANIRYRADNGKPALLHTLNGSGLALPRVLIAIMENYQQEDGSIEIPAVLVPYMGGKTIIGKQPPIGPSRSVIQ
ncbi:MAG: serine--tRNA ligase [Thermomicrobiales bacterium]|nr:serine--tRNA ligase [Thermomicrobiales bacterium]